jgi:hypothetical protein
MEWSRYCIKCCIGKPNILVQSIIFLQPLFESGLPAFFRQEDNRRWIPNYNDGFLIPIDDRFFYILRDMARIGNRYPTIYHDMVNWWVNDEMPCPTKGPFPILRRIAQDYVAMRVGDNLRRDEESHVNDKQWNTWEWDSVSFYLCQAEFRGWFEARNARALLGIFSSICTAGEFYQAVERALSEAVLYANATWAIVQKINSQRGSQEFAMNKIQEWIKYGKVTWTYDCVLPDKGNN